MPTPGEHKTVQARILAYAQAIGWTYVPRAEAEAQRGFDHSKSSPAEQAAEASPYFDELLDSQVRKLNPKYAEGPGALIGDLRRLHADIAGNRDFLAYLRNTKTFYDKVAGRELNLVLIDYENPDNNVFEVTEEFYCHNGRHGTREDVVFLINGIPVLVIECKNATKDEAIALGVDQVRRYHAETPEMFVPQMIFTATEAIGFSYGVTWNWSRRNIFNATSSTGRTRVDKIARYVADHYVKYVEPLGYKAFLVGVDRPACAKYKKALDKYLPPEYSEVVYTGTNDDTADLKAHHIDAKKEKQVRKDFAKAGKLPKILIVTENLLTGYDAPVLYAMYLDKPMRDHTLLQAIARVNRPYEVDEGDGRETRKPHGFVLDFVGIFDKLEKALAFDSDEINAIVKDLGLLKVLFKNEMTHKAPQYLKLVTRGFNDRDADDLIEHFRDKERRKEFFKEFKELEMLYEIISPDAFLRPYIDEYTSLASIYAVVGKAYTKQVYVDRQFQRKTNELVQKHVQSSPIAAVTDFVAIDAQTIELIQQKHGGDDTKVINLIKSIEKTAEEESGDPFLVAMADRAKQVQENYEDRQSSTQEALAELFADIKRNEQRKKEQAEKGYDSLRYFVFTSLKETGVKDAEGVSAKVATAFVEHPNWRQSEAELRELRKAVTFAVYAGVDDLDEVTRIVDRLFSLLVKAT